MCIATDAVFSRSQVSLTKTPKLATDTPKEFALLVPLEIVDKNSRFFVFPRP